LLAEIVRDPKQAALPVDSSEVLGSNQIPVGCLGDMRNNDE
jgi:hypothetical protein